MMAIMLITMMIVVISHPREEEEEDNKDAKSQSEHFVTDVEGEFIKMFPSTFCPFYMVSGQL